MLIKLAKLETIMAIECIGVSSGLIFDKVRFRATKTHEAVFETAVGDRVVYVSKGDEFVLNMSKNDMWEKGDVARSFACLVTNFNFNKFNWYWADGYD